jgi:hypothetical protein
MNAVILALASAWGRLVQKGFRGHDTKLTSDGAPLKEALFHVSRSFMWGHCADFLASDRENDSRYLCLLVRTMNSLGRLDMDIYVKKAARIRERPATVNTHAAI